MPADTTPAILLVDDFEDGRELYAEYLTFKGYRVCTAASGARAIQAIQAECPSLVLLDIGIRDMTGTEVLKWLRDHHVCDGVPIVARNGGGDHASLGGWLRRRDPQAMLA